MAAAKCLLKSPRNLQSSVMLEGEGAGWPASESAATLGSSVTVCKKVLCSNSLLDSADYWLTNDKALCRVELLEEDSDWTSPTVCFLNLGQRKVDRHDDNCVKKLASISPELPRLLGSLAVRQPRENEILLLTGLEPPDILHPDLAHTQAPRGPAVCLVPCAAGWCPTQPANVIFEINKFLIGLQWAQERRGAGIQGRGAGQRPEDDTNHSMSSIEEDFLTASEQLADDCEEDGFKKEPGGREVVDVTRRRRPTAPRGSLSDHQDSEDSEVTVYTPARRRGDAQSTSRHARESAGHYASNLAESVLQDAFIRLSQDEPAFAPEAAVSVSQTRTPGPGFTPTCSFELPTIVIVQSPDNSEGSPDWPGMQGPADQADAAVRGPEPGLPEQQGHCSSSNHASKPLEPTLACGAGVIGTIGSSQAAEQLATEPPAQPLGWQASPGGGDYSFSPAMCGMARVAGAVAVADLLGESREASESEEPSEVYCASRGLLSAAQASTAVPLHCSVTEGTSIEAFRASIAEVLHKEAAEILAQPQGYKSVAHLLETTHNKIVDGITCPKKSYVDETEVDDFITEVADSLFKHALEKAKKKKELDAEGKDVPNLQGFLQESVNNLLFDVLCLTSKKISDIFKCKFDTQEDEVRAFEAATKESREPLSQTQLYNSTENQSCQLQRSEKQSVFPGLRQEKSGSEEREKDADPPGTRSSPAHVKEQRRHAQTKAFSSAKDFGDVQSRSIAREPLGEISAMITERRSRAGSESRQSSLISQSSLTPQSSFSSCSGAFVSLRMDSESRTPVTCFADDLAATVVSMATELAAICLENSSGKQPWFCALQGVACDGSEAHLFPCRSALRRKEGQNGSVASKKHRPPRLSEIKRKTEEQPELMERLVNRVVDETVNLDDDPFALFASEVTARIMNCPELSVVDTSKAGQPRSRLQCERWSRGKAASYESIPEEDADPTGSLNTLLGPGSRLGQNLSRGSSISKQSSCESITDEFSRFMVNQMETEGRGFDLLLDYYAGKNASSILAAAVQQAASKKNGHLAVRRSSCVSKQSSTESITEEFYRFMLRDMDKENRDFHFLARTKEGFPRMPFCIRQSSVPDRRSSDSRLTVNSPIKANSFDGFGRNVHGDTLNIYPTSSVSATGLCKSDSCLYQCGQTDHITDMLIHQTWSSSIEALMKKNKIIADLEDSVDLDIAGDSQPHVQQYAQRLAADIVETGRSVLGGQAAAVEGEGGTAGRQHHMPVGERRRGFKQSRPSGCHGRASQERTCSEGRDGSAAPGRGPREVPLIHIQSDLRDETPGRSGVVTRRLEDSVVASNVRISIAPSPTPADLERDLSLLSEGAESHPDEGAEPGQPSDGKDTDEGVWARPAGGSSGPRELLLVNCDLEREEEVELRVALQWLAASELGAPKLYFRKDTEKISAKFQRVEQLACRRAWRVADFFSAVTQFIQLHHRQQGAPALNSLFDWLLQNH